MKFLKPIIVFSVILLLFASCDMLSPKAAESSPITNAHATVDQTQGVYVFINSRPVKAYDILGNISNDATNQISDAVTGEAGIKNTLKALVGNTTMKELRDDMISRAREMYPNAEGVIFPENMSKCIAIKFKEEN